MSRPPEELGGLFERLSDATTVFLFGAGLGLLLAARAWERSLQPRDIEADNRAMRAFKAERDDYRRYSVVLDIDDVEDKP